MSTRLHDTTWKSSYPPIICTNIIQFFDVFFFVFSVIPCFRRPFARTPCRLGAPLISSGYCCSGHGNKARVHKIDEYWTCSSKITGTMSILYNFVLCIHNICIYIYIYMYMYDMSNLCMYIHNYTHI